MQGVLVEDCQFVDESGSQVHDQVEIADPFEDQSVKQGH